MGGKGKGKGKGKAKGKTKGKFSKDKPAPRTSPKHVAPADGDDEATDAAPAAPAPKAPRPRNRRRQKQEEAEASLPTSEENKSEEGHYTTVVSLIGELTLHTVTHYLASMVLGMIHLVAVKCINFVEQSQRRAQLTVSAFPLVVFDAIAIQLRRTVAFEECRKQPIPVLTAIDGADFYLLENHFQQLEGIKTQYLVSNLSTCDVRLASATVDGTRIYVQLPYSACCQHG